MGGLRCADRSLLKHRVHALAAILTLALGIGANTALFTAAYAVLLRPVDVPGLGRLAVVRDEFPGLNLRSVDVSSVAVERLAGRSDLFVSIGASVNADFSLTGRGDPQRVAGVQTVGEYFRTFGVRPFLGRFYAPEEERSGRSQVAVLSYAFWRRAFGGDRGVIGRRMELDGASYEIAGVLPPGFSYPPAAEIYTPLPERSPTRGANALVAVARMREGLKIAQVRQQLAAQSAALARELGMGEALGYRQIAIPFAEFNAGQLRPALLALMAAVGFVLLIVCANLAGLQLVRAAALAREFAMRAAIGAGRAALARCALAESALLALAGGGLGLPVGWLALRALATWRPGEMQAIGPLSLNPYVLAFTAAISALAGLAFGIAPALRAARVDVQAALRESPRGVSAGAARRRALAWLAATQIALALALVYGSGLLARSFGSALRANPGFRPERVVSMEFWLPRNRYPNTAAYLAFYRDFEDRLHALPGLRAAGLTSDLPFTRFRNSRPFEIPGRPLSPGRPLRHADMRRVNADFFEAMGIPVLAGRMFTDADNANAPPVALIDAQLARQYFPGEDPIGKTVSQGRPATVIGVVGGVSHERLGEPPKPTIYYPATQSPSWRMFVVARGSISDSAVAGMVRSALNRTDPAAPLFDIQTMPERIDRSLSTRRLAVYGMSAFAVLALLLAALGVYGVLSYSVGQRTHEMGIRAALGATRAALTGMVLRQGLGLAATGVLLGSAASIIMARLLKSLLYGVNSRDPWTLGLGIAILLPVTLAACYLPARRAAKADPATALRAE